MSTINETVKEKSTAYLTISFYDEDNVLASPATGTWQVHDKESGNVLLAETIISPIASQVTVTLTPIMNSLVNYRNKEETRIVTVKGIYGTTDEVNDEYEYDVINLIYVS